MKQLIRTLLLASIFLFPCAFATQSAAPTSKLSAIIHRIANLRQTIENYWHKKTEIRSQLADTEIKIGHIARKLQTTNQKLAHERALLRQNENKQAHYKKSLNQQKLQLAKQLHAMYMLGRQPYLKILLNQQDPETISRFLRYYHYLNRARITVIQDIQQTTAQLKKTAKKIREQKVALEKIQRNQLRQHRSLQTERVNRKHLLSRTTKKIESKKSELTQLLKNKKALENIITQLKVEATLAGAGFNQMHHKLSWPVSSHRLLQRYHQLVAFGHMRSTGILIKANFGVPVHAVYGGKVIFSDWLKGFGQLIIIQHGKNYMTIYARNQSVYVDKGDAVKTGETIATVGNSGGFSQPALYFEIRYRGRPINPMRYLK